MIAAYLHYKLNLGGQQLSSLQKTKWLASFSMSLSFLVFFAFS
jgi:hypothetical protein